jgi:hypothetical protein
VVKQRALRAHRRAAVLLPGEVFPQGVAKDYQVLDVPAEQGVVLRWKNRREVNNLMKCTKPWTNYHAFVTSKDSKEEELNIIYIRHLGP